MEGLVTLVVLMLFLYSIGKLSKKNERRVERAIGRFLKLIKRIDGRNQAEEDTNKATPDVTDPTLPTNLDEIFSAHNISTREAEIIRLICDGKSNREIEHELYISILTVKDHVHNIYKKTGVKNRVQLANWVRSLVQQRDAKIH